MPKGYSLHIGINNVDQNAYPGMPILNAAVKDAIDWQKFAKKKGFHTRILKDKRAKAATVLSAMLALRDQAVSGDLVLITYSGHGSDIPNNIPGREFPEPFDQTWCLYDRELLDEEIYDSFRRFRKGVRIVVVSDSCSSGTITKDLTNLCCGQLLSEGLELLSTAYGNKIKSAPANTASGHLISNMTLYRNIQERLSTKKFSMKAAVKLLAACQDDEVTLDGDENGLFTATLLHLLQDPATANASAKELFIRSSMAYQFPHPNLFEYGSIIPSFDKYSPFEINIPDAKKVTGMRKPRKSDFKLHTRNTRSNRMADLKGKVPAVLRIRMQNQADLMFVDDEKSSILSQEIANGILTLEVTLKEIAYEHAWTAAHAIHAALKELDPGLSVTPILAVTQAADSRVSREADINNPDYIRDWPPALDNPKVPIGWHLDDEHSQLSKAAMAVKQQNPGARVRIAHLDTGYQSHAALPTHLQPSLARSFVTGEQSNQAIDPIGSGGQEGHGLGTITLLAGNSVTKSQTFNEFEGFIGAIPWAEIIPLRISDSVVIWNTDNFCKAVDYAIAQGCEVISMSMAGKADNQMAAAVNRAYEAGIVIVSAAGNNWYRGTGWILPKCVLYPAAFERVIAATGTMYNHKPYNKPFLNHGRFKIGTKYMQGSYGPESKMRFALAAYTPNTPWATAAIPFVRSGGGTSSATPQIAAAAALYIAHHRTEMEAKGYYQSGQQWKKVEAVRQALYRSAAKAEKFTDWKKYYGNGIMQAFDALSIPVLNENQLIKAPAAEVQWQGWFEILRTFFNPKYRSKKVQLVPKDALIAELTDLLMIDPELFNYLDDLDMNNKKSIRKLLRDTVFIKKITESTYASIYLKSSINTITNMN